MARRARRLSFHDIRDDRLARVVPPSWSSPNAWLEEEQIVAQSYCRDRQEGQARRLVIWCEARGMVPQLTSVAGPYGITVYSSGGFDSATVKYDAARDFAQVGHVEILHVGDHDPSGVHLFSALKEDLQAFLPWFAAEDEDTTGETCLTCTRLAVTPEQIEAYGLPTAPPKKSDRRRFTGETAQAEALPPNVLADILRTAIIERLDHEHLQVVLAHEAEERDRLVAYVQTLTLPETGETR